VCEQHGLCVRFVWDKGGWLCSERAAKSEQVASEHDRAKERERLESFEGRFEAQHRVDFSQVSCPPPPSSLNPSSVEPSSLGCGHFYDPRSLQLQLLGALKPTNAPILDDKLHEQISNKPKPLGLLERQQNGSIRRAFRCSPSFLSR